MLKLLFIPLFIVFFFGFYSCKTHEKIVYFQGGSTDSITSIRNYTPILKTDDYLSIQITGDDPEAAVPFNLPPTSALLSGYTNGIPALSGYLIDSKGEIIIPIIGKLMVLGLNRNEAANLIQNKLKDYIKNPIVHIQIQNFKVTVIGDVKAPGSFKIPNERVTILEALAIAGDLEITANRKNILVIRDENGVKSEFRVDLTKKDLFNSPVYYLSQNDVIYVEPNSVKRSESMLWKSSSQLFFSISSFLITTLTYFTLK